MSKHIVSLTSLGLSAGEHEIKVVSRNAANPYGVDSTGKYYTEPIVPDVPEEDVFDDSQIIGRWVFNETLTFTDDFNYDWAENNSLPLDFLCNGEYYDSISVVVASNQLLYGSNNDYLSVYSDGWAKSTYRTVEISDISRLTIAQKNSVLNLLTTYAVKEEEGTAGLAYFTYNATSYTFEQGMTWEEYIDSDYNSSGKFWGSSLVIVSESSNSYYWLRLNAADVKITDYVQSETYSRGSKLSGAGSSP